MKRNTLNRFSICLLQSKSLLLVLCLLFSALAVRAQENPPCVLSATLPIYGTPGGSINITSLPASLPASFGIIGTLIVNQSSTWTGKHVYMFGGAQIIVNTGQTFELSGTVLEGCDKIWKGIYLGGGGRIYINSGSRVSDAVSAVETQGLNVIIINGAELTRNFYGLNFHNCTTDLYPSFLNLTIDGVGPLKLPYTGQPANLYGPRGKAGLFFSELIYYNFDATNMTIKRCEIGAWLINTEGSISRVRFEDIIWYQPKPLGIAVLIEGAVTTPQYAYTVVLCNFINCNIGIDMNNGITYNFIQNQMTKVNTGIRVRNSFTQYSSTINSNTINGANNGIIVHSNPGNHIYIGGNTLNGISGSGIYVAGDGDPFLNTNSLLQTIANTIHIEAGAALNPFNNDQAVGITLSKIGTGANIEKNYIYLPGNNTGTNNIGISATECVGTIFHKNHITQDVPNSNAMHTGIYYGNSYNCAIVCNALKNTDIGMVISGNNAVGEISYNQFNFHTSAGMLFKDAPTPSINGAHANSGNVWLYPTSAANPGVISLLSASENASMQFIVDAAENPSFSPYVTGINLFVIQSSPELTFTCDPNSNLVEEIPEERSETFDTLEKESVRMAISTSPNPSNGSFTVNWTAGESLDARLDLIDLMGKTIYSSHLDPANPQPVRINDLKPGIYFARITDAARGYSAVSKVIVQ